MEILAVLLFIILLIVILSFKKSVNANLEKLNHEIWVLKDELLKNARQKNVTDVIPEIKKVPAEVKPSPEPPKEKPYWETGFKPVEEIAKHEPLKVEPAPQRIAAAHSPKEIRVEIKETITAPSSKIIQPPPPPPAPGFFERHPDLEKFIGENLINKIGIAILVLAIGFFVKYAIDQQWIGPVGRVGIGILCGGILTGLAHRLRINYKGFSSVLAGGGLAIFYFTIALAYHQFHLFGQVTSFVIMIVITAFAVLLSLLYNRQELAVIALVGGFATPFMVSNGSGDYQTLFAYLLVLNSGLLVMAYYKAWRLLNILSFAFTVILFLTWVIKLPDNTIATTYRNGLLFATAFYLLFFIINIANNIKENKRFIASDFGILLLNTSLYFAAGLYFITAMNANNYRGLFSASMGIFNLGASYLLFRKQQVDKNILYLLIGITLTFVSLTAPLQLHGNDITLFWASEAVLLYWLHQRSSIGIIRYSSFIIWFAMLLSLLMDWFNEYNNTAALPVVFNKGFITGVYVAAACYALAMLMKKENTTTPVTNKLLSNIASIAGLIILFIAGALEINYQFLYYYPNTAINVQYILLYTFVLVLLYSLIAKKIAKLKIPWQTLTILITICLLLYLVFIRESFVLLHELMDGKKYLRSILQHTGLGAIVLVILILPGDKFFAHSFCRCKRSQHYKLGACVAG